MKNRLFIVGILFILALTGCKSCGGHDRTLLSFVPSDTKGAVVFSDLATTVKNLSQLIDKFSTGPLATFINQGHMELNRRIGFDPLKVEDIKKLGLAPSRGLAIVPVDNQPVIIAGVANRKTLQTELQKRMKEIAAAKDHSTKTIAGVTIEFISVKLAQTTSPALIYTFSGDYVLIAGAKTPPETLARLVQLKKEQRLDTAKWFQDVTAKAGKQPDMLMVINAAQAKALDSTLPNVASWIDKGLAWSVTIQPSSVESRIFIGLSADTAKKMMGFTEGIKNAHLEQYLPADTVVALKLRANAGKLLDEAFGLDPNFKNEFDNAVQSAKKATGRDLEKDSIRNLTGNLAIGVSLGTSDQINNLLRTLSRGSGNIPAEAPEDIANAVQFFYWAQVKDASSWMQMIQNVLSMTEDSDLKASKTSDKGMTIYRLENKTAGEGLMFLLQKDDIIGGCFGKSCIDRAKGLLAGKEKSLSATLSGGTKRLFDQPSLAVGYLNWKQILDTVNGLDASSMGDGGMATKMVLDLAMTAVKNLKELTGVIHFSQSGAEISGRLELQ